MKEFIKRNFFFYNTHFSFLVPEHANYANIK